MRAIYARCEGIFKLADQHDDGLDAKPSDRAISLAKQVAGVLPGIGPALTEILLDDIPGQRMDRFAEFARQLDRRITGLELAEAAKDPRNLDLLEEGAFQSARALSNERLEYIAKIVADGLGDDEAARLESKRLLNLLDQIDDDQIIIMTSQLRRHWQDDFREKHANILTPPRAHMGSSREDHDKAEVFQLARDNLIQLGLLRPRFAQPKKDALPEFDSKTGMIKAQGFELSPRGRLLLRRIGLAEDDEF